MKVLRINKDWRITIPIDIRKEKGWIAGTKLGIEKTESGYRIFELEKEAGVKVV